MIDDISHERLLREARVEVFQLCIPKTVPGHQIGKALPAILFYTLFVAATAGAATCGGDFSAFLSVVSREAAASGISRTVIDSAFAGLMLDGAVLAFDRRQRGTFRKSFEEYAATRVIHARINRARQLMQRHAALLTRIERQFGVPATLLMAIWTLESDNGTGDMGKLPVIRTLATLAHDCRRTELFQSELLAALQIVQRGDLILRELICAYAGEIGPDAVSALLPILRTRARDLSSSHLCSVP